MDQEEEIAVQEFAKFEERLKHQKDSHATISAGDADAINA